MMNPKLGVAQTALLEAARQLEVAGHALQRETAPGAGLTIILTNNIATIARNLATEVRYGVSFHGRGGT